LSSGMIPVSGSTKDPESSFGLCRFSCAALPYRSVAHVVHFGVLLDSLLRRYARRMAFLTGIEPATLQFTKPNALPLSYKNVFDIKHA
jgi:hypothetical protein